MEINERKNEIIVTKAEYKKAMKVGTSEFKALLEAKALYPNAKVVTKKSKNQGNYKKLTKEFILGYIEANDEEKLDDFKELFESIGCSYFDEEKNEVKTISFFYIRNQFLNTYPKFMNEKDRQKHDKKKAKENKSTTSEKSNVVEIKDAG
ncbi:MAG: hypothetical protein E7536_03200 [Ruminococcaceae bacterium]|nr:hypothetical protein [Oscillospiraceae bacterium]